MHERRNAVLAAVLLISIAWAMFSWLVVPQAALGLPGLVWHRILAVLLAAALTIHLYFALSPAGRGRTQRGSD